MKLLVIVLFDEPTLDEILEAFVELDIGAVTVLDSHGIGNVLVAEDPIFAGFRDIARHHQFQKVILAYIRSESRYKEALETLDGICDFDTYPERGYRFSVPAADFKGAPQVF